MKRVKHPGYREAGFTDSLAEARLWALRREEEIRA